MLKILRTATLWCLCLAAFAMPWEESIKIIGDSRAPALAGIGALGFGLLSVLLDMRMRRLGAFQIAVLAFIAWSALSFFWTIDTIWTADRVGTYAQLAVLSWLIWEFAGEPHQQELLMQSYVVGAYVSALDMLRNVASGVTYISTTGYVHESFTSGKFRPNDLAFMFVLAMPMAWYLATRRPGGIRMWLNRLFLPVAMICVFLTASRGALIPALCALLIIPLTMGQLGRRAKLLIAALAIVAVPVTVAVVPQSSWNRLATTKSDLESGTLTHRREIWRAGFQVFNAHPLAGVGPGNYVVAASAYLDRARPAHNAFIAVMVEQGLIGLTLFCALFLTGLFDLRFMQRLDRRFWAVLMFTLSVGLLPRNWDYKKPTWFVLSVCACAGAAARALVESERKRLAVTSFGRSPLGAWAHVAQSHARLEHPARVLADGRTRG